jgi:hypothetical protein
VLINGSSTDKFNIPQGLRQGYPLSPFLFLIVAEELNVTKKTAEVGLIYGYKAEVREFQISHLQFTYKTLLLCQKSENNVWAN